MTDKRSPFEIRGDVVPAGTRLDLQLPIASFPTGTPVTLPLSVLHGRHDGPTIWLNAAIHGDEIGGVAIIRRVLASLSANTLHGTLVVAPVVNVHGFLTGDRYLPDRRDLNRCFPGSAKGSLARRMAHLLMTEVVSRCSVGIDLHTGSDGRCNLPQIRADLSDDHTLEVATAFGAPVMMHSKVRDGSLRGAATKAGATVLLFEGGEALRFHQPSIQAGVVGVRRVMASLGMIEPVAAPERAPLRSSTSKWVRASRSGLAQIDCALGDDVTKGQVLGQIHDAMGRRLARLKSSADGIVVGIKVEPLVHRGDAMVHVATVTTQDWK